MPSLAHHPDAVHLGLDVHKDSISVAILNPGCDGAEVEKIFNDEESVRRLIGRFDQRGALRSCYEAGPTGFELARLLKSMGVACEVIAPSISHKSSPTAALQWLISLGKPGRLGMNHRKPDRRHYYSGAAGPRQQGTHPRWRDSEA